MASSSEDRPRDVNGEELEPFGPWTRDEVIEELDEAHRRLERNAAAEIGASTKYASLLIDIRKLMDEARNE